MNSFTQFLTIKPMKYLALLLLFIGLINCTGKSSSDDSGDKTVKIENNEQIEPKDEFLITPQKIKVHAEKP